MAVWCVEDDENIRGIEEYTLRQTGFDVRGFGDGEAFFEALAGDMPQLVLLDIMLPGMDGVQVLKRLRSNPATSGVPVIMVTAKGEEYDKVQSLDLGADDYLVKPFGMMEMVSRIKAVLRRSFGKPCPDVLECDGMEMNIDERTVVVDGERAHLTYKEFELLRLLMQNPGRVFTREQIFAGVWEESFVGESRTVDVHIQTLRSKLGAHASKIETVRGVGYKLEARAI